MHDHRQGSSRARSGDSVHQRPPEGWMRCRRWLDRTCGVDGDGPSVACQKASLATEAFTLERRVTMPHTTPSHVDARAFIKSVHGLRYQVKDVARAVTFYTEQLGFTLEHQQLPAFASVSLGQVQILLSGPGASGSRPLPNGQRQEPGGWNRVVLKVSDLPGC